MLSDRKIKKKLNEELKPTVSVEQFCLDMGITFQTQASREKRVGKWLWAKVFLPVASAVAVSLCIALPITLSRDDGAVDPPKYGETDVAYEIIGIESLYADEDILMFNRSYVQKDGTSYIISSIDGSMTLGYKISYVTYAEVIDGVPNFAVTFDYIIRCYDGYTINGASAYLNADKLYDLYGIKFKYNIVGNCASSTAYISFEYDKCDYFMQLNSFAQLTEINDDSVQLFLRKAFAEEKLNDEAAGG